MKNFGLCSLPDVIWIYFCIFRNLNGCFHLVIMCWCNMDVLFLVQVVFLEKRLLLFDEEFELMTVVMNMISCVNETFLVSFTRKRLEYFSHYFSIKIMEIWRFYSIIEYLNSHFVLVTSVWTKFHCVNSCTK